MRNSKAPAPGTARALPALVLALALCLCACGGPDAAQLVSRALGIDAAGAEVLRCEDGHGGFHGDGTAYIVLRFPDGALLEQLRADGDWRALPLDATAQALAYGREEEDGRTGPYLDGVALPAIDEGYYRLIDRQDGAEGDILSRASFNFTLAIYDAAAQTLHFVQVDT